MGEIFEVAIRLSPEQRESFLDGTCGSDAQLRYEVESLLGAHAKQPAFLERLAEGVVLPSMRRLVSESDSSRNMDRPSGEIISHYEILEKLGSGGMGVVYKARDIKLDRIVALKFLPHFLSADLDAKQRFVHEAKAASALEHPNICVIHEIDEAGQGQLFIAMSFYEGETLKQKIERGKLSVEESIEIALQVARGLGRAHEQGIIHRDVKPGNVVVTQRGEVKIVDFGLAKLVGVTHLTKNGSTMGTTSYMSPEQVTGEEVDRRTDLWSLGVMLYEMLSGKRPFRGENDQAVLFSILHTEPRPIRELRPDVPEDLENIVSKLLEKDRENRYHRSDEVIRDLELLRSPSSKTGSRIRDFTRPRHKGWRWGMAAATLVLMLAAIWMLDVILASPSGEIEEQASVAVMYFENQTPEKDLERVLVNMLTTNLARYDGLDVISNQRLFDILRDLKRENTTEIDAAVATEIAHRANVKTMLMGSIVQLGDRIRINAQLVDARSGQVISSVQESGGQVEDVFEMVDRLTEKIGTELGVVSGTEPYKLADVTTDSYEAYRLYHEGLEQLWRWNWNSARDRFEQAALLDTTFALANLYLSFADMKLGTHGGWAIQFVNMDAPDADTVQVKIDRRTAIERAKRHATKATDREQHHIDTFYALLNGEVSRAESLATAWTLFYPDDRDAFLMLAEASESGGKIDQKRRAIERAMEIDPMHAPAYNDLAYVYSVQSQHEKAFSTVARYRELYPEVANVYDSSWEIYLRAGRLDEAYRIVMEAVREHPDWVSFYLSAALIRLLQDQPEQARQLARRAVTLDQKWEVMAQQVTGYTFLYEGRYTEAQKAFEQAARTAEAKNLVHEQVVALWEVGKTEAELGLIDDALDTFEYAASLAKAAGLRGVDARIYFDAARTLAARGEDDRAEEMAARYRTVNNPRLIKEYDALLRAEAGVTRRDPSLIRTALAELGEPSRIYCPHYLRFDAMAFALEGEPEKAIDLYNRRINDTMRARYWGDVYNFFSERAKLHYRLGLFHEQQRDTARAIEHFETLLSQWHGADADIPELQDARYRLGKLTQAEAA